MLIQGLYTLPALFAKEQARSCESPLDFLTRKTTPTVHHYGLCESQRGNPRRYVLHGLLRQFRIRFTSSKTNVKNTHKRSLWVFFLFSQLPKKVEI